VPARPDQAGPARARQERAERDWPGLRRSEGQAGRWSAPGCGRRDAVRCWTAPPGWQT